MCILISSCVTIPNIRPCSVAGTMNAGASCAWTLSGEVERLNLDQLIDFIEPNEEREKGGAIIISARHWEKLKTAIEQACRKLGRKCKVERELLLSAKNLKKLEQ